MVAFTADAPSLRYRPGVMQTFFFFPAIVSRPTTHGSPTHTSQARRSHRPLVSHLNCLVSSELSEVNTFISSRSDRWPSPSIRSLRHTRDVLTRLQTAGDQGHHSHHLRYSTSHRRWTYLVTHSINPSTTNQAETTLPNSESCRHYSEVPLPRQHHGRASTLHRPQVAPQGRLW